VLIFFPRMGDAKRKTHHHAQGIITASAQHTARHSLYGIDAILFQVSIRDANSGGGGGGQGGHAAPLASRLHRIPTHFLLNLHGI
jgi:hypothetical protein